MILNIETSTTNCSVSISNGTELMSFISVDSGYTHSENLANFSLQVINDADIKPSDLNAIAISSGPGSYTGLRIGAGFAKGLCSALRIPLISINTLKILCQSALEEINEDGLLCPALDARRNEVFLGMLDQDLNWKIEPKALILDEDEISMGGDQQLFVFGSGAPKIKEFYPGDRFSMVEGIIPNAKVMPILSNHYFEKKAFQNIHQFKPDYLKPFFLQKKKKKSA
ncbi:MAG: tRNA (adenosine(37)-N6)-threonylcarbamoyltransferase complex dimerization subunit type 1 TsaB [Flavobacteriales bacterium]|nr:tRNA (adenosine(37)-N6)-threonylcarbamoyltransferase complex dimerization subunit type 1 TsaB [Flavobacteriales bacterium]